MLIYSLKNLQSTVDFLLKRFGVSEATLGQVQYCLLFRVRLVNASMMHVLRK
jgi:hypothetical protein